ncbi:MAG: ShET2/EspL2 family type III secretion system effector toxin [Comamonadaceae bacterium]|nr:MAG: ShET2/EspL2 family type III secretion system effector toxin [Comamonadaceae bacterium]
MPLSIDGRNLSDKNSDIYWKKVDPQDATTNLNWQVAVPAHLNSGRDDQADLYKCRHLSLAYVLSAAKDPKFKADLSIFQSPESIIANVSPDEWIDFVKNAPNRTVIDADSFGEYLQARFDHLAEGKSAKDLIETGGTLYINTPNHTLAVALRMKTDPATGIQKNVVRFYDPNVTKNQVRRAEERPLQELRKLKFADFCRPDVRELYFDGGPAAISILSDDTPLPPLDPRLSGHQDADADLIGARVSLAMTDDIPSELDRVRARLAKDRATTGIAPSLYAMSAILGTDTGMPALYVAMDNSAVEAIAAWGRLLEFVPENQRARFLAAESRDGWTALAMALGNQRSDSIRAWGQLLQLIPEGERSGLLDARTDADAPCLGEIMAANSAGSITAWGSLLERVSENQRADLLGVRGQDGWSGLDKAVSQARVDAIAAWGELLASVPEAERVRLVESKSPNSTTALQLAMYSRQPDAALPAWGELLHHIPENDRVRLLAGGIDFATALDSPAAAIRSWGDLFKWVPVSRRAELMKGAQADGEPFIYEAMKTGNAPAIAAWGELLNDIPKSRRAALMAGESDRHLLALQIAMESNQPEAIRAWGELLKKIPEAERADLLIGKSIHDGMTALAAGRLMQVQPEAIAAWDELVRLLPEKDQERVRQLS